MKNLRTTLALSLCAFGLLGCDQEPTERYFNNIELSVVEPGDALQLSQFRKDIEEAQIIYAAFQNFETPQIADLLIAAKERGAEVYIVGDVDNRGQSGFLRLEEESDIPITYGDGAFSYLPDPNINTIVGRCGYDVDNNIATCPPKAQAEPLPPADGIYRPGEYNLMSHAFLLTDKRVVWNFTPNSFSNDGAGPRITQRIQSEFMWEAYEREFKQMFADVFAVTLDVYNGPVKSDGQHLTNYLSDSYVTNNGEVEVLFNPQDRIVKKMIDETYRAKASVWIMTDVFYEDLFAEALKYKADHFDVRVITRPQTNPVIDTDVLRFADADGGELPTIIIMDEAKDRNGNLRPRRVMVASHPIWRTSPFRIFTELPDDRAEIYPSDYFIDGNLWSLVEYQAQSHNNKQIDEIVALFEKQWEDATPAGGN